MEPMKKKLMVGFERRAEWEGKLKIVIEQIRGALGIEFNEQEQCWLDAMPGALADLIYADMLRSVVFEFGGEVCDVQIQYYPEAEEQEDLDVSIIDAADWQVDSLKVRIRVENTSFAAAVAGWMPQDFCSDRLTIQLEQAEAEAIPGGNERDIEPGAEDSEESKEQEDGEKANREEENGKEVE